MVFADRIVTLKFCENHKDYMSENELDLLKFSNRVIRNNQLRLLQYQFLTNKKNKELEKEVRRNPKNFNRLREAYLELENFAYLEFRKIFLINAEQMIYFFNKFFPEKRSRDVQENVKDPRICVKVLVENSNSESLVLSLFRMPLNQDKEIEFAARENTAFREIIENQESHFLSNNIPLDILNNRYRNARILTEKVGQYESAIRKEEPSFYENEWKYCWREERDLKDSPLRENYYTSTFVLPISLTTEEAAEAMCDDFKERFNAWGKRRIILAFLCFDHQNVNFFDEDIDTRFGYFFADILSLYLFQYMECTYYSTTFREAFKLLKNSDKSNF